MVFVRRGVYAPGVFRFSVQWDVGESGLSWPVLHFPPILLHPLVEVRCATDQPANGRLDLHLYTTLAPSRAWTTAPMHPDFLLHMAQYIALCFQDTGLAAIRPPWVLNEHVYTYVHPLTSLYQTDRTLFDRLAAQSAHLSTTDNSLYDGQSGSGLPGDIHPALAPTHAHTDHEAYVSIPFATLASPALEAVREQLGEAPVGARAL